MGDDFFPAFPHAETKQAMDTYKKIATSRFVYTHFFYKNHVLTQKGSKNRNKNNWNSRKKYLISVKDKWKLRLFDAQNTNKNCEKYCSTPLFLLSKNIKKNILAEN